MITKKSGNILEQGTEALVNTVNCVGVMGRGIALQFREAYPENYKQYKAACKRNEVVPGRMLVFEMNMLMGHRLIINFPTKRHWREKSRIEDIVSGLKDLVAVLRRYQIRSVAIPPLGCGLGGLNWDVVRPMIENALNELPDVNVFLFEPSVQIPLSSGIIHTEKPKLTVGRAALLALIGRYRAAMMDVSISLLEIHKLLYFLQAAGEPLQLNYRKAIYGPYAEKLRHVLSLLNGHYISGYDDHVDSPEKQIDIVGNAIEEGEAFLEVYPLTRERFERVCELIDGFETPFGMELLSTVHWVATNSGATTKELAIKETYAWNERKKMFSESQLGIAWDTLEKHGWLNNKTSSSIAQIA